MGEDFLASTDSARSARPLRSAQSVTLPEPLVLENGGRLSQVTVCFETYGALDPDAGNAVLVCHALSGDSHVARHDGNDDPGWWDVLVGPGLPVDTERHFVICPNVLGGCRGTTGPNSIDPETGRPYGRDFPTITIGDMVEVQHRLLRALGIRKLRAVIGGSMGGQQVLEWARRFPGFVDGCVPIATTARLTSQALAFDVVGRNAILHSPETGLAIARMIGHITYLSRESMELKFDADRDRPRDIPTEFEKRFSVGSYLGYQGDRFVERFDANSYISLTLAMDLLDLGATRDALAENLGRAECRWLILSFSSDWLFPPEESRRLVDALVSAGRPVSYCNVQSPFGHDSFLLEHNVEVHGELVRAFLENLAPSRASPGTGISPDNGAAPGGVTRSGPPRESSSESGGAEPRLRERRDVATGPGAGAGMGGRRDPLSIFQPDRLDYDTIIRLIPRGASVLDLGCGNGELLARLSEAGFERLTGVELDEKALVSCVRQGLDALQIDLNEHFRPFPDASYDTVVVSRTLQAVLDVQGLLTEIVRIGKRGIVSFPNFGYHKLRRMLADEGRSPSSKGVLRFPWYDTPNRRFFTIADFEDLCAEKGIAVHTRIALDTEAGVEITDDPNLNADLAIFVIARG
ncbi:MAG TPA: homoserine O-acetyltransferase [Spirochaetia bacterium]